MPTATHSSSCAFLGPKSPCNLVGFFHLRLLCSVRIDSGCHLAQRAMAADRFGRFRPKAGSSKVAATAAQLTAQKSSVRRWPTVVVQSLLTAAQPEL